MGKTLEVARDRASDDTTTVLPTEVARGIYIENAPSLRALKLMHVMIGVAAGRMADDVAHEMRLADIRRIDGMGHLDQKALKPLFVELRQTVLVIESPDEGRYAVGGLLDDAEVDYSSDAAGDMRVKWWFGRRFKIMAEKSDHWAIIDRQTVFHLRSQYSILLFQHIASLVGLERVRSKTFDIADLRAVFGLEEGKLDRFSNFNQRVLQPAIAEINQLARFFVSASPVKEGRNVIGVTVEWAAKPSLAETRKELAGHSAGRKARRAGTQEAIVGAIPFPATEGVGFTEPFASIREAAGIHRDDGRRVAEAFRGAMKAKDVALNAPDIAKLFEDFCRNQWAASA